MRSESFHLPNLDSLHLQELCELGAAAIVVGGLVLGNRYGSENLRSSMLIFPQRVADVHAHGIAYYDSGTRIRIVLDKHAWEEDGLNLYEYAQRTIESRGCEIKSENISRSDLSILYGQANFNVSPRGCFGSLNSE